MLAVIRSLSLDRVQRLLGALLEQSEFELVRFENQVAKGGKGVPDAMIQSSCRILIETKTARNAVDLEQINRHLERLKDATEVTKVLLVITPDENRPPVLDTLKDERIAWASFVALDQAIEELLDDKYVVVSEREAFLLRELQNMLMDEGLVASENDVVVVAARRAWPLYHDHRIHAYVCQPNRTFQRVDRIGFYSNGQVHPLVPKVLERHDEVEMRRGHEGPLGTLVNRLLDENLRKEGDRNEVFLLSTPDSPDTLRLPRAVPNDLKTRTGKSTAFTMGQRYVSSGALLAAKTTSDLAQP